MRRRSFLTMGGAAGLALTMPGVASAAVATPGRTRAATGRHDFGSPGSLRDLAAPIGLHIGTAVIPFDLDTPAYAAILAEQFSAVTPGNAMKWGVVEPVQGQFDWSDADTLVSFAEQHGQLTESRGALGQRGFQGVAPLGWRSPGRR